MQEESRRVSGNRTAEYLVREYYKELNKQPDKPPAGKPKTEPENPKPTKTRKPRPKIASVQGVNLADYILLPSHDIYVAKERTLQGKDWYKTQAAVHKQDARMLTLREFADFLLLLRSGNAEDGLGNKISKTELDNLNLDITEVRDPYRAEWLDAKFEEKNGVMHVNYNHKTKGKKLEAVNSEPLETCVMKNCKVELASFNRQGLPLNEGTDFNYWYPINERVARFDGVAGRADLGCYGGPLNSGPGLGVRLAREK